MMHQASVSPVESQSVTSRILAGQVALVTGASRGIGLAIAKRLASLGAQLCLCARDAGKLEDARAEIEGAGGKALAVVADVSRSGDVDNLIEKTAAALGPVQILVNNAGIGYFAPTHEAPERSWDAVLDTNLKSVFLVSKAVAPGMIQKHSGHIVNISSIAGKSAFAGGGIYCASKWGVMGLTQCMAEDLRPHGIRVSVICPGSVNTEFSPHTGKDVSKMLQPDDIAHAVETLVTQQPQSFISEIVLRPTRKP
jgi:NAD(P)-dependent dehydrogenase (short-subunit alcohol dehydrogenase family)